MLKIIGAVLVIAAGSGIGFYEGTELVKHENVMKQIRQMVILLKGEIRYGNSSLFDICRSVAGKMEGESESFLSRAAELIEGTEHRCFSEIFEKCARETGFYKRMTEGEKRRFLEFGKFLGVCDRETQLAQMQLYESELEIGLQELQNEVAEKKKLYQNLGVLGGIFLTLLLW